MVLALLCNDIVTIASSAGSDINGQSHKVGRLGYDTCQFWFECKCIDAYSRTVSVDFKKVLYKGGEIKFKYFMNACNSTDITARFDVYNGEGTRVYRLTRKFGKYQEGGKRPNDWLTFRYQIPEEGEYSIKISASCNGGHDIDDPDVDGGRAAEWVGCWVKGIEFNQPYLVKLKDMFGSKLLGEDEMSGDMNPPYDPIVVRGEDFGNSKTEGAYYTGYKYVSDTQTTVQRNQTVTVYRYFEPIKYEVRLYPNKPADASSNVETLGQASSSGYSNNGNYLSKQYIYDSTTLEKQGDIFKLKGWHPKNDTTWLKHGGTEEVNSGEMNLRDTSGIFEIDANWEKNKYTIKYSGNDTTINIYGDITAERFNGSTADTKCLYDTNAVISVCGFSKNGYLFKEWNTKSDGTGTKYSAGQTIINLTDEDGGVIQLYAIWEPIRYDIEFNGNHNTTYSGDATGVNNSWKMNKVNDLRYDQNCVLPDNKYIRRYNVTIKNAEPWLVDKKSQNGNTNPASGWVYYTFVGWQQDANSSVSPYYSYVAGTSIFSNKQNIKNLTNVNNGTVTLYAQWNTGSKTLPSTIAGSNGYNFIDLSTKGYIDNRLYDKQMHNNVDDLGKSVAKGANYVPYKDIVLYGHWFKDLQLTLDLNGGYYDKTYTSLVFSGTIYDYAGKYTFNIIGGKTAKVSGVCEEQSWNINAYGSIGDNGINNNIKAFNENGMELRFLGYGEGSTINNDLVVYNNSKSSKIAISDNKTLKAFYETPLYVRVTLGRVLGEIKFENGSSNIMDTGIQTATSVKIEPAVVIKAGEQGRYGIYVNSNSGAKSKVTFDNAITDIYENDVPGATWLDELNKITPDILEEMQNTAQKSSFNRVFDSTNQYISRKFNMPEYIGTSKSYETSKGKRVYKVLFTNTQPSFYYNYVFGKDEEVDILGYICITGNVPVDGSGSGGTGSSGLGGDIPPVDNLDSIQSEFRTRIK